jgi:hypothetical protein
MTKFVGAAEELNGIVGTERGQAEFHGSIVLVTQGEDVRSHSGESSILLKRRSLDPRALLYCGFAPAPGKDCNCLHIRKPTLVIA